MIKNCEGCGNEFVAQNSRVKYCNKNKVVKCKICKEKIETKCASRERKLCQKIECKKAAHAIAVEASKSPEAQKKKEATTIERFGVPNAMQNKEIARKLQEEQRARNGGKLAFNTSKQRRTMIEKYGVAVPYKNPEIAKKGQEVQRAKNGGKLGFNTEKQRETMIERYGAATTMESPVLFEKMKTTMEKVYGNEHPMKVPELAQKARDVIIKNNGSLFTDAVISKINLHWKSLIEEEFKVEVKTEGKQIPGAVFDLWIEDFNIAVEINPTVTHNSDVSFACIKNSCVGPCQKHENVPIDYHFNRAIKARDLGIKLLQIYDWDKEEEIINVMKNLINDEIPEEKVIDLNKYNLAEGVVSQEVIWHKKKSRVKFNDEEITEKQRQELIKKGFVRVFTAGKIA